MADADLLMIYRALPTADLIDRRDTLLDKLTTITSMGVGPKNFTRDLSAHKSQLAAITFVLNERGRPGGYDSVILTDFSGVGSAPRSGTISNL